MKTLLFMNCYEARVYPPGLVDMVGGCFAGIALKDAKPPFRFTMTLLAILLKEPDDGYILETLFRLKGPKGELTDHKRVFEFTPENDRRSVVEKFSYTFSSYGRHWFQLVRAADQRVLSEFPFSFDPA